MEAIEIPASRCRVVGDHVLALNNYYPPDQLWLPFVRAVFPAVEPEAEQTVKKDGTIYRWREPIAGVPQYNLPFRSALKVTKGLRRRLHDARYPTFDRDSNGKLLRLVIKMEHRNHHDRKKVWDWCQANLSAMYVPSGGSMVCEREEDYCLCLLSGYFLRFEGECDV